MATKRVHFFKEIQFYDQLPYPEDFQAVLRGDAYWYPHPIKIVDYGKFTQIWDMRIIDTNHPQCYYCGKFVKKGNWWKAMGWTGPCPTCDEDLRWQ